MPDNVYEVVSQAARYWFLFLMALIVWRSFRWLRRDRRQRRKRLRLLPDAGYVGEFVVLKGNDELPEGLALPVSGEGILGCLRSDDVYVPVRGVTKKHLWFSFDEDDGLTVEPYGGRTAEVDGETFTGRRRHAYLTHGSRLTVGEAELQLRLFAGFEGAGVRYAPVTEEEPIPETGEPAAPPPTAAPTAFTAEQMAVIRRMQWDAALQAMNAVRAQEPIMVRREPALDEEDEEPLPEEDVPEEDWEADEPGSGLPPEPPRASRRLRRSPLPPLPPIAAAAAGEPGASRRADARGPAPEEAGEDLAPGVTFYPPEPDEEPQPYDPYDAADEDEAPRSLYVEPDEAEKAKRLLWDRYLKGGRRP